MAKYLDENGLKYLWSKIDQKFANSGITDDETIYLKLFNFTAGGG